MLYTYGLYLYCVGDIGDGYKTGELQAKQSRGMSGHWSEEHR